MDIFLPFHRNKIYKANYLLCKSKREVVTFGARNKDRIILYRQSKLSNPIEQIYSGLNIFENYVNYYK